MALAGCNAFPSTSEGPATNSGAPPVLQILSPKSGDTVQAPIEVRYLITGADASIVLELRIRVSVGDPAIFTSDLSVNGIEGTVTMPANKLITGHHDIRFTLVRADGTALAGSQPVTVKNVTIVGQR